MRVIILFMLIFGNCFAQKYYTSFNYGSLISSKNHYSVSLFKINFNYEFEDYNISIGSAITGLSDKLYSNVISRQPEFPYYLDISGFYYTLGVIVKYYPEFFNVLPSIKPFVGTEVGFYIDNSMRSTNTNLPTCEESYIFDLPNDLYANINFGSVFFPESVLSLIFEIKYRFRNPRITFTVPACQFQGLSSSYTEKVDLNMLMWSAGLRVNF